MWAVNDTPLVRDFLVANPPVAVDPDNQLHVVYFFDRHREPHEKLKWAADGITRADYTDLDEILSPLTPAAR